MFFFEGEMIFFGYIDVYLYKVGNKDIVCVMAECQEIFIFMGKEDVYVNFYDEFVKCIIDVFDCYYWIDQLDVF